MNMEGGNISSSDQLEAAGIRLEALLNPVNAGGGNF